MSKEAKPKTEKEKRKHLKSSLNSMARKGNTHKVRTAGRVFKYGTFSFGRNIWLSMAATLVMTITLLVLFITVLASVVLAATAETMREKIDITVYLKPGTSAETLGKLEETIKKDSNVKEVKTATSEEEFKQFKEDYKDDTELSKSLEDEKMQKLLLESMQATMRIKVYNIDNLDSIRDLLKTNGDFIENLDQKKPTTLETNNAQIETISSWANIAKNGGIVLSIVFLAISILVIFNTIRMTIFSRREEIYMMKLVGADNTFIRGPFLVEAQMCGAISGIIASTIGYFGFKFLAPKLNGYGIDVSSITNFLNSEKLILLYVAMIIVGIIVGSISARLAIRKYLHK